MKTATKIFANTYRDSVALMNISAQLAKRPGIIQTSIVMATAANLGLLEAAGLLPEPTEPRPNDLLVAVSAEDEAAIAATFADAELSLKGSDKSPAGSAKMDQAPRSLEMALQQFPRANLALISSPGEYAASEAEKALRLGLDVMIFSDNVSLADEIKLKRFAAGHGRLVMGPDCGSAIIHGLPLGFANVVRRGDIGIVAASGTGLQQVTCLIDKANKGISHAIGTGGRDLNSNVGGISMLAGLDLLATDDSTKVIVLISKPPPAEVMQKILSTAAGISKPIVINFLGMNPDLITGGNLRAAQTLEDAADIAVSISDGRELFDRLHAVPKDLNEWLDQAAKTAPGQKYLRALYSGGTFCYEAQLLLQDIIGPTFSNTPMNEKFMLIDPWISTEHTIIDLGDDIFTRGRPHPMIDHRTRNERILSEAHDRETAVILLDIVLGHGAHADPAGEMAPVLNEAKKIAETDGRSINFVGFVCGTPRDPQGLDQQEAALAKAGIILGRSNADAVRLAGALTAAARSVSAAH